MRLFYAIRLDLSIGRDKIVKRIADYPRSRFLTLVIRGCALVQKVKTLLRRFCFPFLFIQCVLDDLFFFLATGWSSLLSVFRQASLFNCCGHPKSGV